MNRTLTWVFVAVVCAGLGVILAELWKAVALPPAYLLFPVLGEGLTAINVASVYYTFSSENPIFVKIGLSLGLWLVHGIMLGMCLVIMSKFVPVFVKRMLVSVSSPPWNVLHSVLDNVLPQFLQFWFGALFTIVTELCIIPGAAALLFVTAKLKLAGEKFDFSRSQKSTGKVLVLIHGNRFNECQWHYPRMLMHARGWHDSMDIIAVNYFSGPILRSRTEANMTVEGCSKLVLSQIQDELKLRGIEDLEQVVLMGHSLGGVVASYIKEFLAEEAKLPVSNVVAISSPLGGSALLEWAHAIPFLREKFNTQMQFDEFFPRNVQMAKLREKMAANSSSYYAITGRCDPLVRPDSALLGLMHDKNKLLVPYLGHYNIKVSRRALKAILLHVESIIEV